MKAITDGDYTTEPVCKHLKKNLNTMLCMFKVIIAS